MKKQNLNFENIVKIIFVIVLLSTFTQNAFGQNNNIKLTSITGKKTSLNYERAINTTSSGIIGFKFYNEKTKNNFTSQGVRISGEYRLYLTKRTETLSGLYLAPNFSVGKQEVKYSRTTNQGVGLGLLFFAFDLANGNLNSSSYIKDSETITGEANVTAQSLGLKIGYQKKWKNLTMDCGMNLTKNTIKGDPRGLKLSNGTYQDFNKDLAGFWPEGYFGIGFAF